MPVVKGHRAPVSVRLTLVDWVLALVLCVGLQMAWGAQDWANLSQLRLPDTDDMVRLQQIRDWLNGQSWFDLTQHRLGLGDGLPMHWTRVNDLIPALIITLVKPFAGVHNAELAAVLLGPALLFVAFLLLSARAALSLAGTATTTDVSKIAMIIAAFAFPATGMFIPGRIDHHALQIVLLLGAVTAALGVPNARNGALAGAACALSIVVGLETLPQLVAIFGVTAALALYSPERGIARLSGFLTAFGVALVLVRFAFSHQGTSYCDNFSVFHPDALGGLAAAWGRLLGLRRGTRDWFWILGLVTFGSVGYLWFWTTNHVCATGPYGQVDPFLMRVWMAHVGEAQGLFHQSSIGIVYGYSALVLVALGVAAWSVVRPALKQGRAIPTIDQHTIKYLIIAAPLGMSVLVMLFQLRGAYIGAGLAAPLLAVWITQMRARGSVALVASWLLSAGVVHHLLADKLDALLIRAQPAATPLTQASLGKSSGGAGCTDAATMTALNQLPPSRIMGPMDFGAYAIGMTPHHVFAAPYHRNNAGNLAMYRFFMATPDAAAAQARALKIDYVMICSDSFSELNGEPGLANSLVVALKSGHAPPWLARRALEGSSAMLFRVGVK